MAVPSPPSTKNILPNAAKQRANTACRANVSSTSTPFLPAWLALTIPCHGIKYDPIQGLLHVNAKETLKEMETLAERHVDTLVGFASLAYDTPGYGYGEKDANGAPALQVGISKLAKKIRCALHHGQRLGYPLHRR